MSKPGKRKITVELPKIKDLANRPSVFERLGTKKSSAKKTTEHCRQWAQHGSCAFGKSCKFASTHTLISPSKQRAANKDSEKRSVKDDPKSRLHSTVVVRPGHSPDGEIDNWDQNDLEYADTDVLEKRRLQLQRELELQLKMDSGKDMRKDKKKAVSSTSSSRSSSSSSVSSSSSDGSSSTSSSDRDARRKVKKGKQKRNSSSSSDGEVPAKKKFSKSDALKRDKTDSKKNVPKKDEKPLKKQINKKKPAAKTTIGKKSLSPPKKSGGTPPITSKALAKSTVKHGKSPVRRERNRSPSPSHSNRDRDKDRKDKDRDKDRDKERDKDRDRNRARSRSPRKPRSRSPRPHKDARKKESSERSRPVSPKKSTKKDGSSDRHRKRSNSRDRDRGRDHKDRSLERRKDKHDDKDRHDRKDRGRDRKDKRDDKRRGRDRGLGGSRGVDKGLEKPNKPMERLLPRPEERLAALAAISNRALETDKNSTTSKDRQDTLSDRGGRKQDRGERGRSLKRDRMDSLDRDQGEYEIDRQYENDRGMEHYDRGDDRYDGARDDERSPGYGLQGRERHYDAGYDMAGPPRGYPEDDDRMYVDHMGDHRDIGYDDRRPHRDRSWEGRSASMDRERGYMHPHKEWDNDDYRGPGEWGRERHWPIHDPQMNEWGDKDAEMDGWRHRGHPGPHRGRMHDNYGRGVRMDLANKRRPPRNEPQTAEKQTPSPAQPASAPAPQPRQETDDDKPIPDDLSEISDDPDDILEREDMVEHNMDDDSQTGAQDESTKPEPAERDSTQDTSGVGEEKESQDKDDDDNLDFEEISDGELEEERTRAGLGDALGVDWASLVADVRRREQTTPSGGARDRWKPEKVLSRIGLSLEMAGKELVQDIMIKNAETLQEEKKNLEKSSSEDKGVEQNGTHEKGDIPDVTTLHSVGAIQVALEKRKRQRALLFGSGCDITRGLSARRDLALRRFLCHLPATERTGQPRVTPQPSLFQAAKAFMQAPVSG